MLPIFPFNHLTRERRNQIRLLFGCLFCQQLHTYNTKRWQNDQYIFHKLAHNILPGVYLLSGGRIMNQLLTKNIKCILINTIQI